MSNFRIFGSELSPYSVKVRSYFRYKGLPHEWIARSPAVQAEFQKHAKLPLVPLVVTPEGEGVQDSTPIIERFELQHPEPSVVPADPALAFISALLEEYGDEWGNKWMFHYRWRYPPDVWATAERIAQQMMGAQGTLAVAQARAAVAERMTGRLGFVGSNETTQPVIEASFTRALGLLEAHLQTRPYLLGGRPAMADLGLWGQFYEAATDPTPGALMRASAPEVMAWVARMLSPKAEGDVRELGDPGADSHAAPEGRGRHAVPAVVDRERAGHRTWRQELPDEPRRRRVDSGAAEVPCAIAGRDPSQVRGCRGCAGSRGNPAGERLPAVPALSVVPSRSATGRRTPKAPAPAGESRDRRCGRKAAARAAHLRSSSAGRPRPK